jgi:WD40 repeat protein
MTTKISIKQTYGINFLSKTCFCIIDDHNIVYVSGNRIVILNPDSKEQKFITTPNASITMGISAIAVSSKRKLVAVAERAKTPGYVNLFDAITLRKVKTLTFPSTEYSEITCMAFSSDGMHLLTQSKSPDCNLNYWSIEKSPKVLSTCRTTMSDEFPIHQISFCPVNSNIAIVIGRSILRLFRIVDNNLRGTTLKKDQTNYLSHCWIGEILVVGTESGEIHLIDNFELKSTILSNKDTGIWKYSPINFLSSTSKGGFVSGHNQGIIHFFEKNEAKKDHFQYEKTIQIPEVYVDIKHVGFLNEDFLIILTSTKQLITYSLLDQSKEHVTISHLLTSFHGSAITGLGSSIWKPYSIISCSKDKTLRSWNILDKTLEVSTNLDEDPTLLCVHPSGLFVAVAFESKVKIFSILLSSFDVKIQLAIRSCSCLVYSNGGQYLAVVNGSTIHVYDSITGTLISSLRGHSNRIRNIVWDEYDSSFISFGIEGSVYYWNLFPPERKVERVLFPGAVVTGIASKNCTFAYCSGVDGKVRQVPVLHSLDDNSSNIIDDQTNSDTFSKVDGSNTNGMKGEIMYPEVPVGYIGGTMILNENQQLIILGSGDENRPGCIIMVSSTSFNLVDSFVIHGNPITAMCLSASGNMLISGDDRGVIVISEIESSNSVVQQKVQNKKSEVVIVGFELKDEVLMHTLDLDSRKQEVERLLTNISEVTYENNKQLRDKELEYEHIIHQKLSEYSTQLHEENDLYQKVIDQKQIIESKFHNRMSSEKQKQQKELEALERKYKSKIDFEITRCSNLTNEIETSDAKWKEEIKEIQKNNKEIIQSITNKYEGELLEEQILQKRIKDDKVKIDVS